MARVDMSTFGMENFNWLIILHAEGTKMKKKKFIKNDKDETRGMCSYEES